MATEDSTSEATSELIASLSVEQQDIIKQFKVVYFFRYFIELKIYKIPFFYF